MRFRYRKVDCRFWIRVLEVGAVLALATTALGEPKTPPGPEQIQKLVADLAAADFGRREAAQQQLIELGGAARQALEAVADSADLEQRLRARAILEHLRQRQSWEPSRVRLVAKDQPVADIFRAIADQTGNPIRIVGPRQNAEKRVSITLENVAFWQAIDQVCRQARLSSRVQDDPNRSGVIIAPGDSGNFPTAHEGPLRLRLVAYHRTVNQSLNYGDGTTSVQDSPTLNLELAWEQRFTLCRYAGWAQILEARTDAGEDLKTELRQKNALLQLYRRQHQVTFTPRLAPPTRPATRIGLLRVGILLATATDFQTLALASLTPGEVVERGGYELELQSAKEEATRNSYKLRFSRPIPYDRPNSLENVDEYLEVVGEKGAVLPANLQQVIGNKLSVTYTIFVPKKEGKPTSLRFVVGKIGPERRVEFVFKDVPLPRAGF